MLFNGPLRNVKRKWCSSVPWTWLFQWTHIAEKLFREHFDLALTFTWSQRSIWKCQWTHGRMSLPFQSDPGMHSVVNETLRYTGRYALRSKKGRNIGVLYDEPANGAMKIVSLRDVHRDRVRCSDQPLYRSMIFLWKAYWVTPGRGAREKEKERTRGRDREFTSEDVILLGGGKGGGGVITCKARSAKNHWERFAAPCLERKSAIIQ